MSHDPELPDSYYALGWYLYQGKRDYHQALRYFERALELQPNHAQALRGIASVLRRQGRMDEALSYFEQLMVLDPLDAVHVFSAALTRQFLRDYAESERLYTMAVNRAPDVPLLHAVWALMTLSWKGSPEEARRLLERGAGSSIDNPFSRYVAIDLELIAGRYREALDRALVLEEEVLDDQTRYVPVAHLEAAAYRGLGDTARARTREGEARRLLEERVRAHPEDHRPRATLGRVYARLGLADDAVREARRGVELLPPEVDAVLGPIRVEDLAAVYVLTGRHEEAIDQLERLLSLPGFASKESLKADPMWRPLHRHPRFRALVDPAG